jgi:bifunctional DNA-binding transcriptional regulator/antitoxin component of YhaV-PrlF toxin-antitoxin module
VIPKELRNLLGFKDGELFAMYGEGDTLIIKKLYVPSKDEFEEILAEGSEISKKKNISKKDIKKMILEYRNEGS